jgi:transcriptional regulator with XRE-family HTH domain
VDLGTRLRDLRRAAGLSQTELARRANMSQNGVSRVELGHYAPRMDTARRLAHALGVDVEDLFKDPTETSLAEQVLTLVEEQERAHRQAAARAIESEKPQAYFMRAENAAMSLLLAKDSHEQAEAVLALAQALADCKQRLEHLEQQNEPTNGVTNAARS